jgi:hypothetical protein
MLLLWNHNNSKHINVSLYSRRYIQVIAIYSLSVSDVFTSVSPLMWRRRAALVRSDRRRSREETASTELAQWAPSCVLCKPVARSRLRGGEPGAALWCRAVCAGRYCDAFRRMRAVGCVPQDASYQAEWRMMLGSRAWKFVARWVLILNAGSGILECTILTTNQPKS